MPKALYFSLMTNTRIRRESSSSKTPVPAYMLFGEPLQAPDERLIHIETLAARSALHDWSISAHRHRDLHQILVLERGRADIRLDDRSATLRGPCAILVPPGTVHSFGFQRNSQGLVISFATALVAALSANLPGLVERLDRALAFELDRSRLAATDLAALGAMMLREHGRMARGRQGALRGLLGALLANVLRLLPDEFVDAGRDRPTAERELVARFRQIVERRFREHLDVATYARELGITAIKLRRACLGITSQPPIALIHSRLMVEAERQLRYTSMTIAQVAYHLGFEDPAYFTRFFSRRRRTSPKTFRVAAGSELT